MDEILIDRLVLEIPGLSPEDAIKVAERVGQGLSKAQASAEFHGDLTIELNDQAASHGWQQLADAILNPLLERIG
jgi:hypothetical protein